MREEAFLMHALRPPISPSLSGRLRTFPIDLTKDGSAKAMLPHSTFFPLLSATNPNNSINLCHFNNEFLNMLYHERYEGHNR